MVKKKQTRDASTQTDPVIILRKKKPASSAKKKNVDDEAIVSTEKKKRLITKKKRNTNNSRNVYSTARSGVATTVVRKKKKRVAKKHQGETRSAQEESIAPRRNNTRSKGTTSRNSRKKKTVTKKKKYAKKKEGDRFDGVGFVQSKIEIERKLTAKEAKAKYPAVIHMFSGCDDHEKSKGLANVAKSFALLDNPNRKAGGACTASLLSILRTRAKKKKKGMFVGDLSYGTVLKKMRRMLKNKGYKQNPHLSSTRKIKMSQKFDLVPDGIIDGLIGKIFGAKRAVLIGINYEHDEEAKLNGCHNDVKNWTDYLRDVHDFKLKNMRILMDKEGAKRPPTRENIIAAYRWIMKKSKRGDIVFCHYSGHGGQRQHGVGNAQTLIPADYKEKGNIFDFELNEIMCQGFRKGVYCTFVYDCCHSATMLDLPFQFRAENKNVLTKVLKGFEKITI